MNGGRMIDNIVRYWRLTGRKLRRLAAVAHDGRDRYHATFLRNVMSRIGMALVLLAALPILACHHASLVQAQNDPLNNAYKPTVDCNPADYPSNIALSGPLVKLRQDSGSPSGVYGAAPCVTVMATQNEFQSFQVHVQAPSGGYSALNVTMSALTKSTGPGNSFTIPAPDASDNDIVVYREGYIDVTSVSSTSSIFYDSTGYYPDPLIPAIDPYYHQTTAAFPVAVAAGQNQSAWIDVYIPQNAPSGWYQGTVTISNSGATVATLPVIYGVWQWPAGAGGYMPSTATLHSLEFAGYDSLCKAAYTAESACDANYPGVGTGGSDGADVATKEDLAIQLLDNRLSVSSSTAYWPTAADAGLENGTSTGRVSRIMPGSKIGPNQFWNVLTSSNVSTYISKLTTNGWYNPPNEGYRYLVDEPGSTCSNWTTPINEATSSRSWSSPMLPMLVTADLADTTSCGGLNTVDWMVVNIGLMEPQGGSGQRSSYNLWLSGNCCSGSGPARQLWSYLSCYPNCGGAQASYTYPNYDIDSYPVANRAMEWMTFRNQQSGELYYLLDGCFYYTCGGPTDPWASVYEYGNNGDGDLLYPGSKSTNTSKLAAQVGVSTPIWIPSIRLKMMRDGMQDYEYLNLLTNEGQGSFVQSQISSWITNAYTFSVNPSGLTTARQALGQAIHQLTYPVSLLPPTNPIATLQ
jgi:hypothetical protein